MSEVDSRFSSNLGLLSALLSGPCADEDEDEGMGEEKGKGGAKIENGEGGGREKETVSTVEQQQESVMRRGASSEEESSPTQEKKSSKSSYQSAEYWNSRYVKAGATLFDWYVDFEGLRALIEEHCALEGPVLNLGCGNSSLGIDLFDTGFQHVTNMDISDVLIAQMRERYSEKKYASVAWDAMDAQALGYADASFDLVLDKGTLDAVICDQNSGEILYNVFAECSRVLKPGGVLLVVTHGAPADRTCYFDYAEFGFTVTWQKVAYSMSALVIRTLKGILKGKPMSGATKTMMLFATLKAQRDLSKIDWSDDVHLPPKQSAVAYAYICTKNKAESNV